MNEQQSKPLSQWIGVVIGVILPVIAIGIFYLWKMDEFGGWEGFRRFISIADILPKIISLSVIPNLAAFFVFMRINQLNAARGVLLATIVIGFIMVLIRFT